MQTMNHTGNHVTNTWRKIVVRPKHVTRNNGSEQVPILIVIGTVCYIDQSFSVAVAIIGIMGWSVVNL